MARNRVFAFAAAVALFASAGAAGAQSTDTLIDRYASLAGSRDNAKVLVEGLRAGSDFNVGGTSFATPTKKLGNGEVNIALSLLQASLSQQQIASPTPEQLKAGLEPILAQRASGKGWGEIANAMGVRLGDVVRAERAEARDRVARTERPERPERAERPERPERPERAERGR